MREGEIIHNKQAHYCHTTRLRKTPQLRSCNKDNFYCYMYTSQGTYVSVVIQLTIFSEQAAYNCTATDEHACTSRSHRDGSSLTSTKTHDISMFLLANAVRKKCHKYS